MEDLFKAIADAQRRQILELLLIKPLNVNQLHEQFGQISRPAVSQHLKILEDSGLIKIYKAGRERYAYLHKAAFLELEKWLDGFLSNEGIPNEYGVFLSALEYHPGEELSLSVMLQAMLSKDKSFDGLFYIAVKTTGIFCKPSCSANPKPENVLFYQKKEDALKNGYRACKKCKP